ncbi:MAG: nucleotide exchange factor GrpE, partial [Candidatus Acidiferrales bacterium]
MSPHKPDHDPKKHHAEAENSKPEVVFEGGSRTVSPEEGEIGQSDSAGNELASAASLSEQVRKLRAERDELTNTLVRRQADYENYRKRVERERQADSHRGVELLVERLLPVLDAFDRALDARHLPADAEYRTGFELIRRQLWDAL